ncbi:polyamine oxidase 4 [Botrytis cinerea]
MRCPDTDSHTNPSPIKLREQNPPSPPKVCIVGAGLSGLRCADILLQHGFDVTILEGRDRIGGRVHQVNLPSGPLVDLGANWLHGSDDQPLLDIAKSTSTEMHTWAEKGIWFGEDGKPLANGDTMMNEVWEIIHGAFKYSEENSDSIDPDKSLYDFIEEKLLERYPDDAEKRRISIQFADIWGTFVGSSVKKQSLKFFWLEECIDGANIFVAGTYKNILAQVAKPALENAKIRHLTKAIRVETNSKNVTVFTDDGKSLEFDEVVMTTPLGWLKKNKQAFQPALPTRFLSAIDSLGFGCLEKVYITFPQAFWTDLTLSPSSQTFDEIVPLSSFTSENAHPTLLLYIYGEQSQLFAQTLSGLRTPAERDAFLIPFFKPYYSLLPNYQEGHADCTPLSCVGTTWINDDLAGNGSYTNFQVGLREGDEDVKVLREGLPERRLWFAGEHTAPFIALGTTTGAYWSGEAVGRRMVEAYGMGEKGV